jgi:hypothetical protein
MKTKLIAPVASLALGGASLFAQSALTITGTVSDAMCGAHHMMKDATARSARGNASSEALTMPSSVAVRSTP